MKIIWERLILIFRNLVLINILDYMVSGSLRFSLGLGWFIF